MMNRRSRTHFLGVLGALGAPFAGPGLPARAADTYTMRMSVPVAASSVQGQTGTRFAAAVERRSNGQLKIEVYPNGSLAKQKESIDGLLTGVVDFAIESSAFLEPLLPHYQVFDIPFMFKDNASALKVLNGPIGAELVAEGEAKGILGLAWLMLGARNFQTTSKVVTAPDDLKGLRIRIVGGEVFVAMYQSLGAVPVVIDGPETLVALTQHTVDGMDMSLDSMVTGKYDTVVKHVCLSNHAISVQPILGSRRKIEALPAPLQRIIKEEAKAVTPFALALNNELDANAVQTLKKNGVAFTDSRYALFHKAVEPVYALVQAKIGGNLVDRVSRAAG